MAIFILITRLQEGECFVLYEFGTFSGEVLGHVLLDKSTGELELLKSNLESRYWEDFYLSRVREVLSRCHQRGDYPDRTCYQSP